jgi:hypothetical protein
MIMEYDTPQKQKHKIDVSYEDWSVKCRRNIADLHIQPLHKQLLCRNDEEGEVYPRLWAHGSSLFYLSIFVLH